MPKSDPFKRSAESQKLIAKVKKIRALMGGTESMRAAGDEYLPKFEAETTNAYTARKKMSVLFNAMRKTVKDMSGRVFDKPIVLGDDVPAPIVEWATNIDLEGRKLTMFAENVFEEKLQTGISWIMVEAPATAPDGQEKTSGGQAKDAKIRPWMFHLTIDDFLGWKIDTVNNQRVLTQARIQESIAVPKDEYNDEFVDQVRVLTRTGAGIEVKVFRKDEEGNPELIAEPFFIEKATEITIVPVYANRTGFFTGEPLLEDLADVNITHWQSQSDQRNILHVARVPILFGRGIPKEQTITVSSSQAITVGSSDADLKWTELEGKSIESGRQDLKDLEFQMQTLGLQLLVDRTADITATGEQKDDEKSKSTLAMCAGNTQDALETALDWMAVYGGLGEDGGSVEVNKDFGAGAMTQGEIAFLLQSVTTGQISHETFIAECIRRGLLMESVDAEVEREKIADEGGGLSLVDAA